MLQCTACSAIFETPWLQRRFYVSEEERKTSVADEIFAWDRTVSRLMDAQVIYKKKINRPTAHRERERGRQKGGVGLFL